MVIVFTVCILVAYSHCRAIFVTLNFSHMIVPQSGSDTFIRKPTKNESFTGELGKKGRRWRERERERGGGGGGSNHLKWREG